MEYLRRMKVLHTGNMQDSELALSLVLQYVEHVLHDEHSMHILEHLQQAESISKSRCKLLQAIKHSYKGRCYLVLCGVQTSHGFGKLDKCLLFPFDYLSAQHRSLMQVSFCKHW